MVTDCGAKFGTADFGLEALLDALAVPSGPWVRFDVTKAHRRFDPSADLHGGGGVFATGDHEDLGVALCGRVPRVRSTSTGRTRTPCSAVRAG